MWMATYMYMYTKDRQKRERVCVCVLTVNLSIYRHVNSTSLGAIVHPTAVSHVLPSMFQNYSVDWLTAKGMLHMFMPTAYIM